MTDYSWQNTVPYESREWYEHVAQLSHGTTNGVDNCTWRGKILTWLLKIPQQGSCRRCNARKWLTDNPPPLPYLDKSKYSLDTRARHLLDLWLQWAEHQDFEEGEFTALVHDSQDAIDELVDRELKTNDCT